MTDNHDRWITPLRTFTNAEGHLLRRWEEHYRRLEVPTQRRRTNGKTELLVDRDRDSEIWDREVTCE